MKEVHKASKRAKTFETQKVVKKLKDLRYELIPLFFLLCVLNVFCRKKGDNIQAIGEYEAELACLKVT
jgi:hypothetical protein